MQATASLTGSPSFTSYSNSKIAARTIEEFISDEFDSDEEEFEFAMTARDSELPSQTSAGEIFQNGKIRPFYPVFNRDFSLGRIEIPNEIGKENSVRDSVSPKIGLPLRKERETTITTSSSSLLGADEFDVVPTLTCCCVWPPKAAAEEEGRCKKRRKWKDMSMLQLCHLICVKIPL